MAVEAALYGRRRTKYADEVKEATDGYRQEMDTSHRSLRNAALWRRQESLQ